MAATEGAVVPASSPARGSSYQQLVKQLDAQYRASRKDWKHRSPGFGGTKDRFSSRKPPVDAMYDQDYSSIERRSRSQQAVSSKAGSWSASKVSQRPPVRAAACAGEYNPQHPDAAPSTGRSAFASNAPMRPEPRSLSPGQDSQGLPAPSSVAAAATGKGKATSSMKSTSPRFRDPVVNCDTFYEAGYGTIAAKAAATKGKGGPWAKSRAPQRPSAKAGVDKTYDVPLDTMKPGANPAKSSFNTATERFPTPKARAPGVGAYTSPLISAGLLVE